MKAKKFVLIYFKTVKAKRLNQGTEQSEHAAKQNEFTPKQRNSANSLEAGSSSFCVRIMTVCDLGSGARCLISLLCSFEPSWFHDYYAACFKHVASTGNSQYKNRRKYPFTNLKIYHAYEISTHSPK